MLEPGPVLTRLFTFTHERANLAATSLTQCVLYGSTKTSSTLVARIVCACDAFHTMISGRPYRRALAQDHAIAELHKHAGTQFDPEVVAALDAGVRRQGSGSLSY